MGLPDSYYVYGGRTFEVEFYVTQDGKVPGFEYYNDLTEVEKRRFFVVVKTIADAPIGTIFPKTFYNIEDKEHGVYAVKPSQQRFFSFITNNRKLILTNAYRKHSQKMTKIDKGVLKIAIRFKNDYDDRTKRGTYYG